MKVKEREDFKRVRKRLLAQILLEDLEEKGFFLVPSHATDEGVRVPDLVGIPANGSPRPYHLRFLDAVDLHDQRIPLEEDVRKDALCYLELLRGVSLLYNKRAFQSPTMSDGDRGRFVQKYRELGRQEYWRRFLQNT